MDNFTYSYPTKVYFGKGSTEKALNSELQKYGKPSCSPMAAVQLNGTESMMRLFCFFKRQEKR